MSSSTQLPRLMDNPGFKRAIENHALNVIKRNADMLGKKMLYINGALQMSKYLSRGLTSVKFPSTRFRNLSTPSKMASPIYYDLPAHRIYTCSIYVFFVVLWNINYHLSCYIISYNSSEAFACA